MKEKALLVAVVSAASVVSGGWAQDALGIEPPSDTYYSSGGTSGTAEVEFGTAKVDIKGQTPGSSVEWITVGRERRRDMITRVSRDHGESIDGDSDGLSTFNYAWETPDSSVWVFGDVANDEIQVEAPAGTRIGEVDQSLFGLAWRARTFEARGVAYDVLWLRPGTGAWALSVRDGQDGDGVLNRTVRAELSQFQSAAGGGAPSRAQIGDLFAFVEESTLTVSIVEVQ